MTNKRRRERTPKKAQHSVKRLFAGKIERSAEDAYQKRRSREIMRLGPRERLTTILFDAIKRELLGRQTNGLHLTDDRLANLLERVLKPVCKQLGLEQDEKKEKKEPNEE